MLEVMKKKGVGELHKKLLQASGSKITPRRLALLAILKKASSPLSVEAIATALSGRMDRVTVYRALDALSAAGAVRRIDVGHTHAHYELVGDHHHHLICKSCGRIEDVPQCSGATLERRALQTSKHFDRIEDHALEFFGLCNSCAV